MTPEDKQETEAVEAEKQKDIYDVLPDLIPVAYAQQADTEVVAEEIVDKLAHVIEEFRRDYEFAKAKLELLSTLTQNEIEMLQAYRTVCSRTNSKDVIWDEDCMRLKVQENKEYFRWRIVPTPPPTGDFQS